MNNQRNMIIAMLLMGVLLFGWDAGLRHFYPNMDKAKKPAAAASPTPAATASPTREGGLANATDQLAEAKALNSNLASAARVRIEAPGLVGSINLAGAVIDDLSTVRHKASLDKSSAPVRIFSPAGTPAVHFAQVGWVAANGQSAEPDGNTLWAAPADAKLTPQTPVTLSYTNPTGQTFTLTYAIDEIGRAHV